MYVSGWHFTCFLMNTCIIYPTGVYCKRDIWQKDNIFYHLWFCFHTKQISCDNIFLRKIKFNMTPNAISVPYLGNCIICYILNIEKVIGTSQWKYLWLFFVVDLKILIYRCVEHHRKNIRNKNPLPLRCCSQRYISSCAAKPAAHELRTGGITRSLMEISADIVDLRFWGRYWR